MGTYVLHEHLFALSRVLSSPGEDGHPMRARALLALPLILAAGAITPRATAADAGVAALQVGLHSHGLYKGPIDGLTGPGTAKAIRLLQKRAHLTVDGVVGPKTRSALGRFARHRLGSRKLLIGNKGWDVASLQFQLAEHGFPVRLLRRDLRPAHRHSVAALPGLGRAEERTASPAPRRSARSPLRRPRSRCRSPGR